MILNTRVIFVTLALAGMMFSASSIAAGEDVARQGDGYVHDQWGGIVKSGAGLCWRSGSWTERRAIKECDPDLFKNLRVLDLKVFEDKALFEFDSSKLSVSGKEILKDLMKKSGGGEIKGLKIYGHADKIGNSKYNKTLSERRAMVVASYLTTVGASGIAMQVESYGSERPVTTNGECEKMGSKAKKACLSKDRRVEVQLFVEVE